MFDATSGRNTLFLPEAERFMAEEPQFKITEVITVRVITLSMMFKYILPDFLSLDIEGLDFAVLESTTFPMAGPIVICVEARRNETAKYKAMMALKGYRLYVRMGDNLIFVREEYMEALE